jgi:glycosyltransferase involved in cell wall biosynthesis
MKILYDYQAFNHQQVGGVSRYFCEIISRLAGADGVDIRLFLGLSINRHLDAIGTRPGLCRHGILLPAGIGESRWLSLANRLAFNAAAGRFDAEIYHPTYYTLLARRHPARRVVTVFDMIQELYPEFLLPGDPLPDRKREAVQRADGVICISETTRRDLLQFHDVPESRIRVIPLGVSLNAEPAQDPPYAEPYLLYVGRRGRHKNFSVLLQAYAAAEALRRSALLVCFGGPAPSPAEKRQIAAAGLDSRVLFTGGDDRRLATHYRHAALLVCPSLYEGFGLPPLEAMRYGCAVAAADTPALRETIGDAALFFDPRQSEDLAAKVTELLNSPTRRAALAEAGRSRQALFDWDTCARSTLEFYRELASCPPFRYS